jgi:hypothetical protein
MKKQRQDRINTEGIEEKTLENERKNKMKKINQ